MTRRGFLAAVAGVVVAPLVAHRARSFKADDTITIGSAYPANPPHVVYDRETGISIRFVRTWSPERGRFVTLLDGQAGVKPLR